MDLFGETLAEVTACKPIPIKRPPQKPSRQIPVIEGGLFPYREEIRSERFFATFNSGASAYYDLLGLTSARKDVGTVAGLMSRRTIQLLRDYIIDGGNAFVDTGAFTAFKRWLAGTAKTPIIDFPKVMGVYDEVIQGLPSEVRFNVALVMPDIVGQPEKSLDLLRQYRDDVRRYINFGANVIVPIQKTSGPAGVTAERVFEILGTTTVSLGIPSQAEAMELSDAATIRHDRFHILGRASMTLKLLARVHALLENNEGALISLDATQFRSHTALLGFEQANLIADSEGSQFEGTYDETELLCDVTSSPAWMTEKQVAAIANLYGVKAPKEVKLWLKTHRKQENGLKDLIESFDPDGTLLAAYGVRAAFDNAATKHLSARMRACAVQKVFAD
jgi:hypothetical protein